MANEENEGIEIFGIIPYPRSQFGGQVSVEHKRNTGRALQEQLRESGASSVDVPFVQPDDASGSFPVRVTVPGSGNLVGVRDALRSAGGIHKRFQR